MTGKKRKPARAKGAENATSRRPESGQLRGETLPVPVEAGRIERPGPPVAGIGASAGGLDAFKKFFTAMPHDSGVGFVLIPHLDPRHESLMVELIARHTAMPVAEAADGMKVEANRVYVIPPNKYMTIAGGILRLSGPIERSGPQTSIDLFLRSLGEDKQEQAICIILSGTGAHGTLGLTAVKAAGGMTMVQDPDTAEYPAMPQSAIATDLVDYVLPVEKMPQALTEYIRHDYVTGSKAGAERKETSDDLNQVLALVRARTKLEFRQYRKNMLARRVERRMSLGHFEGWADYLTFLREHPDELRHLSRDLLISVTSFFRDPEAWQALATQVIAPLVRTKGPDTPIRVWCAGCATGEEPYSLGILLLEQVAAAQMYCPIQIFATDVDDDSLDVARRAIYPDSISADVSPERLSRFFTRVSESAYQVSKQLRETVVFARQNLISDAPFSKLDLVVCRNLLIYLEQEVQKKVIALLHFALNEGGWLFLGSSETIGRNIDLFEPQSSKWRIFRRIGPSRSNNLAFPVAQGEGPRQPQAALPGKPAAPPRLPELAQNFLLRRFALACVVINRNYEVLHFAGPTEDYLIQPGGPPTHDLLALARPGLESKLRVVVQRAIRENAAQSVKNVMMRHGNVSHRVNIDVEPLSLSKQTEGLLLIAFQEQAIPEGETIAEAKARTQTAESDLMRQLEQELETTREDLQGTIEELESANEELKASNEEIMSMNEELQSANEELETSKEELQSLNEELSTVNNQLHDKVGDLETTNNDMANFLNCTDIAAVFLDTKFCIRRYTPAATHLFNIIATDVGRPIGDIAKRFDDDELLADAERFLRDLTAREREVRLDDGSWCVRRIIPYRTLDNRIDGIVLTFVDITERKQAADAVVRRLAAIVETSADAIISRDLDGTIRTWNPGAERLYGFAPEEAIGQPLQLTVPDDRVEEWDSVVERLTRGEHVQQLESERVRKDSQRVPVELTVSPLRDSNGRVVSASEVARDLSERKRAESAMRENEKRLAKDVANMTRLQQVSTQLVQAGKPPVLLQEILDAAIVITTADMGNIQLLDPSTGTLKIAVHRGFEKPFLDFFSAVHEGHAACGMALRSQQRIVVDDVTTSPIFAGTPEEPVMQAAGVRAVQCTPLVNRVGQIVGMLSTHFRTPVRLTNQDLRIIDLLARQAADWIERTGAEQALREREERLRAILDAATDAIITIDSRGIIQSANRGAERMFGYAAAEMLGENVSMLMPSPDCESHGGYLARYAQTKDDRVIGTSREIKARRKDGSVFPVELAVSEIDHLGLFTGIHRDLTERKALERDVVEAASQQQQQIGRDLHDTVSQELTALGIQAADLAETLNTEPQAAAALVEKIRNGIQRSERQLRAVMRGLLPVAVDADGLMAALSELADQIQKGHGVACTFTCPERVSVSDNLTACHLFLIAQEAVHNAVKHARPRNIRISLKADAVLQLCVEDDGQNTSEWILNSGEKFARGLGLRIMHNRAAIIGATLTIEPVQPTGTRVLCSLPRRNDAKSENPPAH